MEQNYQLKMKCIEKRKTIAYCRRRLNRNLPIDIDRMLAEVEEEMRLYQLRNREEPDMEPYTDEEHKAILEEERKDYERCLEILQKTLDDILASIDVKNHLTVR